MNTSPKPRLTPEPFLLIALICFALTAGILIAQLTGLIRPSNPTGMPDGEHIAASPKNGLSVTIDGENGVICYRERLNARVALTCMPFAEPGSPITTPR